MIQIQKKQQGLTVDLGILKLTVQEMAYVLSNSNGYIDGDQGMLILIGKRS